MVFSIYSEWVLYVFSYIQPVHLSVCPSIQIPWPLLLLTEMRCVNSENKGLYNSRQRLWALS
jgi:hypothetical protein